MDANVDAKANQAGVAVASHGCTLLLECNGMPWQGGCRDTSHRTGEGRDTAQRPEGRAANVTQVPRMHRYALQTERRAQNSCGR